jgi:hypothetical protein
MGHSQIPELRLINLHIVENGPVKTGRTAETVELSRENKVVCGMGASVFQVFLDN